MNFIKKHKKPMVATAIILAVFAIGFYYYMVDPTNPASGLAVKCIFHEATGWQCPGCGMQRALHAALHGHFLDALRFNYGYIILLPALFISLFDVIWGDKHPRFHKLVNSTNTIIAITILIVGWTILRNVLGI